MALMKMIHVAQYQIIILFQSDWMLFAFSVMTTFLLMRNPYEFDSLEGRDGKMEEDVEEEEEKEAGDTGARECSRARGTAWLGRWC